MDVWANDPEYDTIDPEHVKSQVKSSLKSAFLSTNDLVDKSKYPLSYFIDRIPLEEADEMFRDGDNLPDADSGVIQSCYRDLLRSVYYGIPQDNIHFYDDLDEYEGDNEGDIGDGGTHDDDDDNKYYDDGTDDL